MILVLSAGNDNKKKEKQMKNEYMKGVCDRIANEKALSFRDKYYMIFSDYPIDILRVADSVSYFVKENMMHSWTAQEIITQGAEHFKNS